MRHVHSFRCFAVPALAVFATLVLAGCSGSSEVVAPPTVDVAPAAAATTETTADLPGPATIATGSPLDSAVVAKDSTTPAPGPLSPAPVSGIAALAQQLFDEGRAALSAGDIPKACSKFEASLKLDFGLGTLMNLADCTERAGNKSRACGLYGQAAAEAHARGQSDRENLVLAKRSALGCGP